ncbi:hypothetical protein BKE38_08920 [Pseudoroseomonas deserti]|uniref:Uncharacterized protein n=2 Tax=Teichococcus deserti TaxID=1817963 RepID=A0A1V2H6D8_9PROT|nr:hypothetical protein BKE38_08920 [Pseudoroseomonas deserti]
MSDAEILRALHENLTRRSMPEMVAGRLAGLSAIQAVPALAAQLAEVAGSRPRFSFLPDDFSEPVAPARQIAKAAELFPEIEALPPTERDPAAIEAYVARLSAAIAKAPRKSDFRGDRLDRVGRRAAGLELGGHAYTKRFRFLARLEAHLATYTRERRHRALRLLGKIGLVEGISHDRFAANPAAAAFMAYYAARRGLRSTFTSDSQTRPFDQPAAALLRLAEADPATDWALVARLHPMPEVLARLTPDQRGALLAEWTAALAGLAEELESTWRRSRFQLDDMVVGRGDDSSTWNLLAQAWNSARAAWFSLLEATGQQGLLEECCPGKVMRLMAADVAAWHRADGGGLHPDTAVWRALPQPWAVLRGEAACPRSLVEVACRAAGADPQASGWVAVRLPPEPVPFTPTPELVHGVEVGAPGLALLLRKRGVFSGKASRVAPPPAL